MLKESYRSIEFDLDRRAINQENSGIILAERRGRKIRHAFRHHQRRKNLAFISKAINKVDSCVNCVANLLGKDIRNLPCGRAINEVAINVDCIVSSRVGSRFKSRNIINPDDIQVQGVYQAFVCTYGRPNKLLNLCVRANSKNTVE